MYYTVSRKISINLLRKKGNVKLLELKQIHKIYPAGAGTVEALRGIDLRFRRNEFVSILGPSGCGKTTMLNIIGGLDQYTSGDLIINGRSTRHFKDRDWDAYRNHSVGFVFQSYNLIPHQTVLQNVELALTLSGVSKSQRRKRAIAVLEEVGLGDQIKKKPSQLSGGQMQRVAIARGLVNNPEIILADEPTGALDTETSVQVMELLKEVAKDRLVIMVTHNPDLAREYSTRIIKMLDGRITDDSAPPAEEELVVPEPPATGKSKKERKPSMSLFTAFGLSLKNLLSKKGRSTLTSFAGSIGIIGIALIYAVSQGMTTYINILQEDTLSSYPLTIQASHVDMSSLMKVFMESAQSAHDHDKDAVYSKPAIYEIINAINNLDTTENDLAKFKDYIEAQRKDPNSPLFQAVSGVQYSYNLTPVIYTKDSDGNIIASDTTALMQKIMGEFMGMDPDSMENMKDMAQSNPFYTMMSSGAGAGTMNLWQEMLPGDNGDMISPLLKKQYELLDGRWPSNYNEVVLVVDENNELDDMTLYALGLKSQEEIDAILKAAADKTPLDVDTSRWSYEEILSMTFRTVLPSECFTYDEISGTYTDLRNSDAGLRYLYTRGTELKVTGIIRPSEDAVSAMLSGSIGYTSALTKFIITQAGTSQAVLAQQASPTVDIFTGLPFKESTGSISDADKETAFRAHIDSLDLNGKADAYIRMKSIPSQEQLDAMVNQTMANTSREQMEQTLRDVLAEQTGMDENKILAYLEEMEEQELSELFKEIVAQGMKMQYAAQVKAQMSSFTSQQLVAMLTGEMATLTTEQCALYYEEILTFSESTYEENLITLGCLDLNDPAAINLFATTFESKDDIEAVIAQYNAGKDELSQIRYTDYMGLMMSSITSIINAVTYVLIAFVAISLVVSSIMIGVITLISVQERTKEIGILRAIGASKRNVSSMFVAETVIIGFASGLTGVLMTYLLCIPINAIIFALTDIAALRAYLPVSVAAILVGISMLLTVFAGIIPSRSAAKKDPVVALRTE